MYISLALLVIACVRATSRHLLHLERKVEKIKREDVL